MAPSTSILCYGDSNTWGYIPGSGERLPNKLRWPGILKEELGDSFNIAENGVNGRTINTTDTSKPWRNGLSTLMATLHANKPLNWVILMLGINDFKPAYKHTTSTVLEHFSTLIKQIQKSDCGPKRNGKHQPPKLLVVAPPELNPEGLKHNAEFSVEAAKTTRTFTDRLEEATHALECEFLTIPGLKTSAKDGIHLEQSGHALLGQSIAAWFKR